PTSNLRVQPRCHALALHDVERRGVRRVHAYNFCLALILLETTTVLLWTVGVVALLLLGACNRAPAPPSSAGHGSSTLPSVLLVTLDTTRADAIGPEAVGVETPAFNALAARGRRFQR